MALKTEIFFVFGKHGGTADAMADMAAGATHGQFLPVLMTWYIRENNRLKSGDHEYQKNETFYHPLFPYMRWQTRQTSEKVGLAQKWIPLLE